MFIDKKFKLMGKLSIIDIFLMFFIGIMVYIAIQFSAPPTANASSGDVKIKYTIEIPKSLEGFEKNVIVGETLVDSLKGYNIGTITDVYTEVYKEEVADFENNQIKKASIKGLNYIYIVVEANAQVTEEATSIGQYNVMTGKDVYVKSKYFAGSGFIVKLEKEGASK